jgi:hypothetical protein
MGVMRGATEGFVGAGWPLKSPIRGTKRSAVERPRDIKDDRSLQGVRPAQIPGLAGSGFADETDGPLLVPASDACGTNSVLCYIPSRAVGRKIKGPWNWMRTGDHRPPAVPRHLRHGRADEYLETGDVDEDGDENRL